MCRDGAFAVFGVFAKRMNNEYAEPMGREGYPDRLVAYYRNAK
jgi:hypothetical protein